MIHLANVCIPTSYREKSSAQAEYISKRHANLNFENSLDNARSKRITFPPLIAKADDEDNDGYEVPVNWTPDDDVYSIIPAYWPPSVP